MPVFHANMSCERRCVMQFYFHPMTHEMTYNRLCLRHACDGTALKCLVQLVVLTDAICAHMHTL